MKQAQIGVDQATTTFEPRYNMFQRKGQPDLYCIVPEDRPVPGFITDGYWTFAGTQCSAVPLPGLTEPQRSWACTSAASTCSRSPSRYGRCGARHAGLVPRLGVGSFSTAWAEVTGEGDHEKVNEAA